MLADAAQIIHQAAGSPQARSNAETAAVPMSPPCAPPTVVTQTSTQGARDSDVVTPGTPVSLAALSAQIEALQAMARNHEVRMIEVTPEVTKAVEGGNVPRALLDSGATHAVIPFSGRLEGLEKVSVTLAGDSKEEWLKTAGGTLVVPPVDSNQGATQRQQTILPLGALVETLGCKVTWSRKKGLRVVHPVLGSLRTGVSPNTCPYTQEDQALKLIGELESERLKEFELSVQAMEADLRQLTQPCDPTASLRKYTQTASRDDLIQAVFAQPYLQDVPEAVKVMLCEEIPGVSDEVGWKLIKRLPLSRAKRRALHTSTKWVVNLASGPPVEADPLRSWCQEDNIQYLPVDLRQKGGKGWDLTSSGGVWSVLLWAACTGRIVTVLSSPPHRTWASTDMATDRSHDNPWGIFEIGEPGFKETILAVQDMLLWSLASVSRGSAIPFLKQLPSHGHVGVGMCDVKVFPGLFWKTDAWRSFEVWSMTKTIDFCQGSLGHSWLHPTTIATNLPLDHLSGLPRQGFPQPENGKPRHSDTAWSVGFRKEVVEALAGKVKGPTVDELDKIISGAKSQEDDSPCDAISSEASSDVSAPSQPTGQVSLTPPPPDVSVGVLTSAEREEWRSHIMRGHVPYRRDCKFCVEGAGLGIQHRRVKHPQAYTLSVDLFGPMSGDEKGRDEQSVSANPHLRFGLVGAFRFPKSILSRQPPPPPLNPEVEIISDEPAPIPDMQADLEEYEPSIPGSDENRDGLFPELFGPEAPEYEFAMPVEGAIQHDDQGAAGACDPAKVSEWLEGVDFEGQLKDLTSGVELVTLRYVVGLKSKTGPEVATGVQKLILDITKRFPVKVLHCDPGTEFSSDKLAAWLAQNGVRLQTTVPTDKQGNGVAERTVGWMKSRARTLLAASKLSASYWPLAMRWAAESHNRQVLDMPSLPAFGQPVFHKLKRASGATKELMVRWITARYAAPHLTIPEGHVLITDEGGLVASRGFRTNLVDTSAEPGLELPAIQTKDHVTEIPPPVSSEAEEQLEPALDVPITPSRRLKGKTAVRFLDIEDSCGDPLNRLAQHSLLDDDFTEATFRRLARLLEDAESSSPDRRGNLSGKYVFGAFCHGGQRGITTLAKKYPAVVSFLNKFLKKRLPRECTSRERQWATVMLLHSSDVPVHRDYRNEWNTTNAVVYVPEQLELWAGPSKGHKDSVCDQSLDWTSERVQELGLKGVTFDPRNFHAVRCNHGWVVVGYTPLGIHKIQEEAKFWLHDVGFDLPHPVTECIEVKALKFTPQSSVSEFTSSFLSSVDQASTTQVASSSSDIHNTGDTTDLAADLQPDSVTAFIGWDPNGGNRSHLSDQNLEEMDLYQYLSEREVEWTFKRLRFMGVESPADLYYLYAEDSIEFGLPPEDASSIMFGIHPAGTIRPDNPNGISLRTGEVRLLDRGQRQIPWAVQNRTLGLKRPGPPVPGLGVKDSDDHPDPYVEDWTQLVDPLYEPPANTTPQLYDPADLTGSPSRGNGASGISAVLPEESPSAQVVENPSGSNAVPNYTPRVTALGEEAMNADSYALHAMRMQSIWDAEDEEEFEELMNPALTSHCSHVPLEPDAPIYTEDSAAGIPAVLPEESPIAQVHDRYSCRMVRVGQGITEGTPAESTRGASLVSQSTLPELQRSPSKVPQIGVHFPDAITLSSVPERSAPRESGVTAAAKVEKVLESSFTQNVEELLEKLAGPLEVVHQVSPSEVKRHLEKWKPAAQEEVESLESMKAIVRHKSTSAKALLGVPGVEVIPAKGVFTVKPGKPFRRKVRVVSCGNFAKSVAEDVLYASGAAAETLRALLVHGGGLRRQCWSTDVKCAFLLAPIPDTVQKKYVLKPPAILVALGICSPDEYWEVCRAVYGFKEAPKWWAQFRDQELSKGEFATPQGAARLRRTVSDENLWEIVWNSGFVIGHILVYVDDLLILGSKGTAESVHRWIKSMWNCSDLERATAHKPLRFLGMDIHEVCDEHGVCGFTLSQEGYIDELVRSHALEATPRAVVPIPKDWVKEAPQEETGYSDATLREAQRVTGELLWLSQRTRIDIAFGVGLMSSWVVRSPIFVAKVGLRILSYLANTKGYRLSLVPSGSSELSVFSDASFAPFGERSVSGIVILLNGRCVLWKSRRQSLMSLSTAECELIAACEAVTLAQSLESLVAELHKHGIMKVLRVDNVAAITLAEGGGFAAYQAPPCARSLHKGAS